MRANLSSSSLVQTLPQGLWGEHRKTSFTEESSSFFSRSAKSISNRLPVKTSGFSTTRRPRPVMVAKKG